MSKPATSSFGLDDDDEWQSMPVESSSAADDFAKLDAYANPNDLPYGDEDDDSSDPDDPRRFQSWPSRGTKGSSGHSQAGSGSVAGSSSAGKPKKGWLRSRLTSNSATPSASAGLPAGSSASADPIAPSSSYRAQSATTNATGKHLNIDDARGYDWRSKPAGASSDSDDDDEGKEKGYTQLRLDEDDESEQLHAATEYLFQDGTGGVHGRHDPYGDSVAATPLNQMKTTKQLLSEGQKIAYVGLCSLAAAGLVRMTARVPGKELSSAKQSIESWKVKVMARLYQHMDIESSEQNMIESLAVHGVLPSDLAPSLITTQTIFNPEFDPEALRERREEEREEREQEERDAAFKREREEERIRAEELSSGKPSSFESQSTDRPESFSTDSSQHAPHRGAEPTSTPKMASSKVAENSSAERSSADEHESDIGAGGANSDDEAMSEGDGDGDLGDLGCSNPKRQSQQIVSETKTQHVRGDAIDADESDGDIGALAADDSDVEGDIGEASSSVPRQDRDAANSRVEHAPQSDPAPSGAHEGDLGASASQDAAGPDFPESKTVELDQNGAPRASKEVSCTSKEAQAAKRTSQPILADPNTASQISNAIDATAALQPASGPAPPSLQADAASATHATTLGLTKQPEALEPPPGALDGVTTSISSADETITLDLRWTVLCDLFLVLTADSVYDSRSRALLETVASYLGLTWMDVTKFEKRITDALEIEEGVESLKDMGALERRMQLARKKRIMMVGLATVGGGLVIGLSAGLLAPVIGAGIGAALGGVGIAGTSGFLGGVGGAALITTTGTVGGMSLGGRGMSRRTRSVKTFEFKSIHNNKRVNVIVAVPGFMNGAQDDVRLPFSVIDSIMGDVFSVLWEPDMMQEMGNALGILWNETLVQGVQQVLAATVAGAMFSALAWPLWLTKLGYLIDNPWSNALDRAKAAGYIMADILTRRQLGVRPITLVGYSLGARVIFYCLVELSRMKAYGIVQNVYIMGAPITAKDETWKEARSVVAGRFVSAFSRTDWILGYLHRAASGGLRSIAGLHPVERVQEIENIDVTHVVPGHLQYRALMPLVLSELGFKTTADYFDEPEDLSKIPERQVVLEDSEYELKTVKTQSGGFGKIWKRKVEGKGRPSGSSSPAAASPSRTLPSTPVTGEKGESKASSKAGDYKHDYDEYDDDELPPRIEEPQTQAAAATSEQTEPQSEDVPAQISRSQEPPAPISIAKAQAAAMGDVRAVTVATPEADKPPSRGVHFDTDAILEELRESGIEVKELKSSLPPLFASTSQSSLIDTTPKKRSTGLELPSAAFSADKTPSPSADKAAIESPYRPPLSSASRSGSSTTDSQPGSDSRDSTTASRTPAPYAKSFSSTLDVSSPSNLTYPIASGSASGLSGGPGGGVSLSFASYDDDEIEVSGTPPRAEEQRSHTAYGLSNETVKELEAKFRGAGSQPQSENFAGSGSLDHPMASGNGWAVPTTPWEGPATSLGSSSLDAGLSRPRQQSLTTSGFVADGSGASTPGFSNPLAPPSQTFGGSDALKARKGYETLEEAFVGAATTSSSSSNTKNSAGNDPWAENPWGGGY